MALILQIIGLMFIILSCTIRKNTYSDSESLPIKINFERELLATGETHSFKISRCIEPASPGKLAGPGLARFDFVSVFSTGTTCTFQIFAADSQIAKMENDGITWTGEKGLLFEDKNVVISINPDGSRTGHSKKLKRQYKLKEFSENEGFGSIKLQFTTDLIKDDLGSYDAQFYCAPNTPYSTKIIRENSPQTGGKKFSLSVPILLPASPKESIKFVCGVVNLFKNFELIGIGKTSKIEEIDLSHVHPIWSINDPIQIIDVKAENSDVTIDPNISTELKPNH